MSIGRAPQANSPGAGAFNAVVVWEHLPRGLMGPRRSVRVNVVEDDVGSVRQSVSRSVRQVSQSVVYV